jgi:hypothetical protein
MDEKEPPAPPAELPAPEPSTTRTDTAPAEKPERESVT